MRKNASGRPGLPAALLICTLALWGCAAGPDQPDPGPKGSEITSDPSGETDIDLLALPPSQYAQQFAQAEQQLASFDWMAASTTLGDLRGQLLSNDDQVYVSYLEARIAFIRGDAGLAQQQMKALAASYDGNPGLRYRCLSFQHHILDLQGDTIGAARSAHAILQLVPADYAPAWQRALWRNLERADREQLQTAAGIAIDPDWQAWLELALVSRGETLLLGSELNRWRSDNIDHPAAQTLPGGLSYLLQPTAPAQRIALLLPLSGRLAPAGRAVLDGFLAAHYEHAAPGATGAELLVLDTTAYPSAIEAYNDALLRGADMVVGPLSKNAVAELATLPDRPLPILSLNRVEETLPASGSALVQMSLAPEDEAARIADLAFGTGARSILLVRPAGDWGLKVEEALSDRWHQLGGTIGATAVYSTQETYSSSLQDALGLSQSAQRAVGIRNYFGSSLEFTARRRTDLDAVVLLSRNGAQARSIKPLLAFHYAGDLPVYAISSSYTGVADQRDQDLDGLQLVEMPWLLGSNPELRVAIAAGDTDNGQYTRLNALGADAYLLQSQFSRLQSGPDALLRGDTGLLSMNPQLHILRETSPATFDGGLLVPQ